MIALVGVEKMVVFKQTNLCDIDKFAEKKPTLMAALSEEKILCIPSYVPFH